MNEPTARRHAIDRFHVVTGGPGSGKSTLIASLGALGFGTTREAGRAMIEAETVAGGDALPWADSEAFARAMQTFELASYHEARSRPGEIVFDRGLPDIVGYRRLVGLSVPDDLDRACRTLRYGRRVFIAPPWPAIYVRDRERRQSLAEAEATFHAVGAAYKDLGYELVSLPLACVATRATFVSDAVAAAGRRVCT